jgi:hypothetical protein
MILLNFADSKDDLYHKHRELIIQIYNGDSQLKTFAAKSDTPGRLRTPVQLNAHVVLYRGPLKYTRFLD